MIRDYTTQMFSNAELNLSSITEDVNKMTEQILLKEYNIQNKKSIIDYPITRNIYKLVPYLSFIVGAGICFCPRWLN